VTDEDDPSARIMARLQGTDPPDGFLRSQQRSVQRITPDPHDLPRVGPVRLTGIGYASALW